MSCMRLHYDNGDDIATAIEDGKPHDFSKEMPTMATPTLPTEQEAKDDPKNVMNMLFMMEFINSRNTSCEFPLRLSRLPTQTKH